MDSLNKFEKPRKSIENESRHMFYKSVLSTLICHFFEKSMIAHAALVKKRYICTTICKHTGNSLWNFWKITRLFWLNFQVLTAICIKRTLNYHIMDSSNLDAEKVVGNGQLQHGFFIMPVNNDYTIVDIQCIMGRYFETGSKAVSQQKISKCILC